MEAVESAHREALDQVRATAWARRMSAPGAAVILDTETTDLDGYVVEIGVIDTATGTALLDTLVQAPAAIAPEAHRVHGITHAMLQDAPTWTALLPRLRDITAGRSIIAYNAAFDAGVIARHTRATGGRLEHLADPRQWACLMDRRAQWDRTGRPTRLGAGHRALGDCRAALELLQRMAAGPAA